MAESDHKEMLKKFPEADKPRVFTGGDVRENQLYDSLTEALLKASAIDLAVSFLMDSGIRLILPVLKEAARRKVPIRILCGNYLNITQPSALYTLHGSLGSAVDLRFYNEPSRSFKAYLLKYPDHQEVFVGSSNLSWSALTKGIEWNYRLDSRQDPQSVEAFAASFEDLFEYHAQILDDIALKAYSQQWKKPQVLRQLEKQQVKNFKEPDHALPQPRGAQIEALLSLENTRASGASRALVQAATGIGKTYLAAFDSRAFSRVLFIAHRQEILNQAAHTFHHVRPDKSSGFFRQEEKNTQADLVFASIQTLGRAEELSRFFKPDDFDYLVVDEIKTMDHIQ